MDTQPLTPQDIVKAYTRVTPFLKKTPILTSALLNRWLCGHEIYFKCESLQTTGAFKVRGALNTLLAEKERGQLPKCVVAVSSGNHAQAVAWSGALLNIDTTVVLASYTSIMKRRATASYGARVLTTPTRTEADALARELVAEGAYFLPPFDHDDVIAGQATACYEALDQGIEPDAIFAPCGGGGLLAGTYLASKHLLKAPEIFGGEPLLANDAIRSYSSGEIYRHTIEPKQTLADGARTLAVAARTFQYLQKLDGFAEVPEETIIYWTQWLQHLLKITVEPTSALAMAGAFEWLRYQTSPKKLLVILSGGNCDPGLLPTIWANSMLEELPNLAKPHPHACSRLVTKSTPQQTPAYQPDASRTIVEATSIAAAVA